MDIVVARTFIQVVKTGSFVAASSHLQVTQSAVTARIKNLEIELGCRLFERDKSGVSLTKHGEKFLGYATQIIETWEAARRDLPLADGPERAFRFGADVSLANPLVLLWTATLKTTLPSSAIRVELGDRTSIQKKVRDGLLDAAIVFEPEYAAGMQIEEVVEEKLVHVRTSRKSGDYVHVNWGREFDRQFGLALPDYDRKSLYFDFGPTALQYILLFGGHGYFRARVISSYVEQGVLERIPDMPEFSYPIFAVYPRSFNGNNLPIALDALRATVAGKADWSQRWGTSD